MTQDSLRTYEIPTKSVQHAKIAIDHIITRGKQYGLKDAYRRNNSVYVVCGDMGDTSYRNDFLNEIFGVHN